MSRAGSGAAAKESPPLEGLFAAIDAKDVDAFVSYLTDDATFRFGSAPPVDGKPAIREAVAGFFDSVAALEHNLGLWLVDGATVVCEGETTYTRHDGSRVTVPFADVFDTDGELIRSYKIYADIAPLYAV